MAGLFVAIDQDMRISDWHRDTVALTNFREEEVVGRRILDFFTYDVLELLTEKIEQASRGDETDYFRMSFFTKAGRELDLLMYALATDDGKIALIGDELPSTIPSDICSPSVKISTDLEGVVTEWNEEAEALTGFRSKHLKGKIFAQYFMTENFGAKDFVIRKMMRAFAGERVEPFTVPIFTICGELKIIKVSMQPDFYQGQIVGATLSGSQAAQNDEKGACIKNVAGAWSMDTLPTTCPSSDLPELDSSGNW